MSNAKGMVSLWAAWLLTCLTELPLPMQSESKAKFVFSFLQQGTLFVNKRAAWADVRGQISEPTHSHLQLSWPGKCWQNFNFRLFTVRIHASSSVFPTWAALAACCVCTSSRNTVADFRTVPEFWKPSFPSIYNLHGNVCFSHYHVDLKLTVKEKKKLTICWRINWFSLQILSFLLPKQLPDLDFIGKY